MSEPAGTAPPADAHRRPPARALLPANPLRRWRRRFAHRRNAIQTRTGGAPLDFKSVHAHWIVGRDLCLYRAEDFAAIPKNRRDAAVELGIPVWSPFERTGHYCVWSGSTAMVWFWDRDAVDIRPADLGMAEPDAHAARVRTLPESVFQPRLGTGFRLQACAKGFDLQYWEDDILKDSLWFPERPSDARLQAFLNQAETAPDETGAAAAPASRGVAFSPASFSEPWYSPVTLRAWLIANERTLVIAGLAFCAAVAAFQEARVWRYHFAYRSAAAELRQLDRQLAPVLDARNELVAIDARNEFLAGILDEPSQAELMVRVDRALPSDSTEFQAWRYQQRDLAITLSDNAVLDAVAVVTGLQADAMFRAVQPGRIRPEGTEVTLGIDPAAARKP